VRFAGCVSSQSIHQRQPKTGYTSLPKFKLEWVSFAACGLNKQLNAAAFRLAGIYCEWCRSAAGNLLPYAYRHWLGYPYYSTSEFIALLIICNNNIVLLRLELIRIITLLAYYNNIRRRKMNTNNYNLLA
jgi:hypothetical protein